MTTHLDVIRATYRVAAFGVYSGTYAKTGKSMRATFAHLYRLRDGKILSMEQVVDSALVQQALTTN
jgi:ketosteroid isomerase-like protein